MKFQLFPAAAVWLVCQSLALSAMAQPDPKSSLASEDEINRQRNEATVIELIGKHNENGELGSLQEAKKKFLAVNTVLEVDKKLALGDILLDLHKKEQAVRKANPPRKATDPIADKQYQENKKAFEEIKNSGLGDREKAFALGQLFNELDAIIVTKQSEALMIGGSAKKLDESNWAVELKVLNDGLKKLEEVKNSGSGHPHIDTAINNYKSFVKTFNENQSSFADRYGKIEEEVAKNFLSLQNDIVDHLNTAATGNTGQPQFYADELLRIAVYSNPDRTRGARDKFIALGSSETNVDNGKFSKALVNVRLLNAVDRSKKEKLKDFIGVVDILEEIFKNQTHTQATRNTLIKSVINDEIIMEGFNKLTSAERKEDSFDTYFVRIRDLLQQIESSTRDSALLGIIKEARNNLTHIRFVGPLS